MLFEINYLCLSEVDFWDAIEELFFDEFFDDLGPDRPFERISTSESGRGNFTTSISIL